MSCLQQGVYTHVGTARSLSVTTRGNNLATTQLHACTTTYFVKNYVHLYILCTCRCEWQTLLDTVKCEIVSCSGNEAMDAYILRFVNVALILPTDVQASVRSFSLA